MLFSTLGWIGILLFVKMFVNVGVKKNTKFLGIFILPLIFFLPNIHFWTVAVGKDSLIFFAIALFCFSISKERKRYLLSIIGLFLIIMIRPHIGIFLLISVGISIFIWGKMSPFIKLPIFLVLALGAYFTMFTILTKLGMNAVNLEELLNYFNKREGYYVGKGYSASSVNLVGMPIPFKMFTYTFRPLFERFSINFLILSIENLAFLLLTLTMFRKGFFRWLSQSQFIIKFSFIYYLVGVAVMSYIMSNFGVASRQKTMFLYSLLLVVLSHLAYWKNKIKSIKIEEAQNTAT